MSNAEWPKKCFTIIQNEVAPRARKVGVSLREFCDPTALSTLARLEYDGIITRKTLREILDERVKEMQKRRLSYCDKEWKETR